MGLAVVMMMMMMMKTTSTTCYLLRNDTKNNTDHGLADYRLSPLIFLFIFFLCTTTRRPAAHYICTVIFSRGTFPGPAHIPHPTQLYTEHSPMPDSDSPVPPLYMC
ncbi:hypothetical protein BDZ94DRAFT_1252699, partial [Collybia nuda]